MTAQPAEQKRPSSSDAKRIATKAQLSRLGVHTIRLHSGDFVKIRIPDLSTLVAVDAVPQQLRKIALSRVMDEITGSAEGALTEEAISENGGKTPEQMEKDAELIRETVHLHIWLVAQMFVEPAYTFEELLPDSDVALPQEDMVMLIRIALRERNTDAAGVRLGVARIDPQAVTFRTKHGCGEDCEGCLEALEEHSTLGLDFMRVRQLLEQAEAG